MARPKEVQAAIKKAKAAWKEARKTKPGSSDFSAPKLKKYGTHKCKWDAKYGLNKNEELYASLIWTIVDGADKGKSHNMYFALAGDDDEKVQKAMGRLAAAVQTLTGVDTSEEDFTDPTALLDLLDDIHKDNPLAMADIKENGEYLNVYINELIEDEDSDDDEEEEDEEEESEEDEEEEEEEKPKRGAKKATKKASAKKPKKDEEEDEEEEEEEAEEEDDEEEVVEPAKDDVVDYKPPKSRKTLKCVVKTVNKRAQTCTLQEEDGTKKFTDVAWDELVF